MNLQPTSATAHADTVQRAVGVALRRNPRLRDSRITVTVADEGLVTLTGSVPTQALRREVETICWTVAGVHSLHDEMHVGR
ncbi:BON domain-containing protein [Pseudonocardia sp. GCM10023141]|uniref:BON domain-containing protein n=1 Tax=Pseudonocardia sp. GCM10023141 TaxID=3252653 RepID=UPI00361CA2E0